MKRLFIQLMSIVLVLAISLSQFDYLIELRIGAGQSTYDQCETLSGILDGDEQSSDQDENQKEVKTYPLQTPVMPHLLSHSQLKDVSKCRFSSESDKLLSNPYLKAIYQPPRFV